MRNVIAYFLTLLVVFHTAGLSVIYLVELQCCEMEFERCENYNADEGELLIEFTTGKTDFVLINNHEILHEGKLFDIRKKEVRNGSIVYLAMSDDKEDRCMEGLDRIAKSSSSGSSVPGKLPALKILKYTCSTRNLNVTMRFPLCTDLMAGTFTSGDYLAPDKDIFSPPPNSLPQA